MISKKIMDVRVDFGLNMGGVLDIIENKLLKDEKNHIVCTTNPEFIVDAQSDDEFKEIINQSSLSTPDGVGVLYAKKYLDRVEKYKKNFFLPFRAFMCGAWLGISTFLTKKNITEERITGVDLTYKICEESSKKNYSIFFLGGRQKKSVSKQSQTSDMDMSTEAANRIRKLYPGVNIIGSTSKFNRGKIDDNKTVEYINKCMEEKGIDKIDFLFVAYNHIHQEKWIMRNKDKISAKVSIGCGGTFNYIVGNYTLTPSIYIKNNLDWLYRLMTQPWRLKRILKAFPIFPMKVYISSLKRDIK
ncbi:WecB/TagA/CpsF family glycosyltransferase [Patescibacteria group bacterium]|nr:WecB/TagA/CpsF family glycosyltransferase [Patescibacteria group bacterium]